MADITEFVNNEEGVVVRGKLNAMRTLLNALTNISGMIKVAGESLSVAAAADVPATVMVIQGKTMAAGSWTTDGANKKYTLADANITVNHSVDLIVVNASASIAEAAKLLPETNSIAGNVEVWATNTPSGTITCNLRLTRIIT